LRFAILAGVGALSVAAQPGQSDIIGTTDYATPGSVQQVRMICDEDGRCYRSRGGRASVRDSYGYDQPRERYHRTPYYRDRDWDDGPRAGSASAPRRQCRCRRSASATIAGNASTP